MNLTPNVELLLRAILAEVRRLEAMPDRPIPGTDRDDRREQYLEREEYRQAGVRHDLERWLGYPPSRSDSAVFSRALRHMEAMGLVVRLNRYGGRRATHVQFTDTGRAMAERLVADQDAAMAALLEDLGMPVEGPAAERQDARNPLDSPSPPR